MFKHGLKMSEKMNSITQSSHDFHVVEPDVLRWPNTVLAHAFADAN